MTKKLSTDTEAAEKMGSTNVMSSHFAKKNPYYPRVQQIGKHEYGTKDFCKEGEN